MKFDKRTTDYILDMIESHRLTEKNMQRDCGCMYESSEHQAAAEALDRLWNSVVHMSHQEITE